MLKHQFLRKVSIHRLTKEYSQTFIELNCNKRKTMVNKIKNESYI